MKTTTNYGLNKPELTDFYDVEHFNANMDVIDKKLKEVETTGSDAAEALAAHVDKGGTNPHGTTKSDVGLSNVPNVTTNNQTPTYAVPDSVSELTSGEKLSTAFGKIAKFIKDMIAKFGTTDISNIADGTLTGAVSAVNENLNDFVNIRMHTGGGFATMAEDIYAHWGEIKSETGGIRFSNGATVFSGIYYKFSETIGSMLLHQTGSNIVYIWKLYDNIPSLDTVALNSDLPQLLVSEVLVQSDSNASLNMSIDYYDVISVIPITGDIMLTPFKSSSANSWYVRCTDVYGGAITTQPNITIKVYYKTR